MPRIKKPGLSYFPCDTDYFRSRAVRRVMKAVGDAAAAVLLQLMCDVYAGEGYYLSADQEYFEDLADSFYEIDDGYVRRVVEAAIRWGIFHEGMYARYGILTSAEIQQQYLTCRKRRDLSSLDRRYRLLTGTETEAESPTESPAERLGQKTAEKTAEIGAETAISPASASETRPPKTAENGTESTKNDVLSPINAENGTSGTQRKEKENKSKAKQNKENPLLSSPETGGTPAAPRKGASEDGVGKEENFSALSVRQRRVWTQDDILALRPPADGLRRNLSGLICNLRLYRVPPAEQYAIVLKSNFGVIGHPVWKGFEPLRTSHGKIKMPGRFLLSYCR